MGLDSDSEFYYSSYLDLCYLISNRRRYVLFVPILVQCTITNLVVLISDLSLFSFYGIWIHYGPK